jgi:hypothetical protein
LWILRTFNNKKNPVGKEVIAGKNISIKKQKLPENNTGKVPGSL